MDYLERKNKLVKFRSSSRLAVAGATCCNVSILSAELEYKYLFFILIHWNWPSLKGLVCKLSDKKAIHKQFENLYCFCTYIFKIEHGNLIFLLAL